MSVTLNTQLEDLMFSSQIPDLDLSTDDDNEAIVSIVSGGTTVFSATHIPYQRTIVVHDIRSVIEYYMRQGNHALRSFEIRGRHNGGVQTRVSQPHHAKAVQGGKVESGLRSHTPFIYERYRRGGALLLPLSFPPFIILVTALNNDSLRNKECNSSNKPIQKPQKHGLYNLKK